MTGARPMPEGPHLLTVRRAVRAWFGEHCPERAVVVGLSGGADSLALTAACVAEGAQVHAVVVDHALQAGSAEVAHRAAEQARDLGCSRAEVRTVSVTGAGGPEAAARRARYAALDAVRGDRPILLGHTLNDQAETVLLGLGRGSGSRSLRGMAAWDPPRGRPLLTVRRESTVGACAELGLAAWDDPHNLDPSFVRVRLRGEVLPLLEDVLHGGVAGALARTADQLREDGAVLDALAADIAVSARVGDALEVSALVEVPGALRRRVIREWLADRGVPLRNEAQVRAVDDLVGAWRGQGGVAVAGGGPVERLVVERRRGKLDLVRWTGRAASE
ncbi:tRNA lysidine(34) synthetase TilS [Rhodococcus sp. BP-332]|uniref:tRNA lysidine(34) synthetase TilS n=1 Tax=Rhodococcus sp. BP-332 TaxID=2739447 RepID=UPI001C9B7A2D|nr:tRNA lysidine(34) synthetase TilS [Rhodococcus sp. BP-332]MBY6678578.1 tRNA lysidine(34) synthetase TilS [Rhodococcus sp. BP-332]